MFENPERCGVAGKVLDVDPEDHSVQVDLVQNMGKAWFPIASICAVGGGGNKSAVEDQGQIAADGANSVEVCLVFCLSQPSSLGK